MDGRPRVANGENLFYFDFGVVRESEVIRNHHLIVGGQRTALEHTGDFHQLIVLTSDLNVEPLGAVSVNFEQQRPAVTGKDGLLRNQQAVVESLAGNDGAHEHARAHSPTRVLET